MKNTMPMIHARKHTRLKDKGEEEEEDIFGLKVRDPRIEESPEAHTPEEQKMPEVSETTDSAAGSQDRTNVRQVKTSRQE